LSKASASFFKKRSKKLFLIWAGGVGETVPLVENNKSLSGSSGE
jgi:hypothetical protein